MAVRSAPPPGVLATVSLIAASPYIAGYTIGYAARCGNNPFTEHRLVEETTHVVVLADQLTGSEAELLESTIRREILSDRRNTLYRKYDRPRREDDTNLKVGQYDPKAAHRPIHFLYMSFWEYPEADLTLESGKN